MGPMNRDKTVTFCYVVPLDGYVEGHGYRVSIAKEGETGHFPTGNWPYEGKPGQARPYFWGHDYEQAVKHADDANEVLGVDKKRSIEIVASTMGFSKRRRRSR